MGNKRARALFFIFFLFKKYTFLCSLAKFGRISPRINQPQLNIKLINFIGSLIKNLL